MDAVLSTVGELSFYAFSSACFDTRRLCPAAPGRPRWRPVRGAGLPLAPAEQTYRLIERNFSTLYQQTDFTPQITNSYFNHSDLYRFAGIPLAITPQNGFQMEVFGQLYNKSSQIYAQMSQDLSLYRTLRVDMMGDQSDEIAIGMGLGIPLTTRLTVKALASSNEIPGYGSANYAIGMEWHF